MLGVCQVVHFCVRVSKPKRRNHWSIVTFRNVHTCHRTSTNRQATTEWISKKIVPLLRHTPTIMRQGLIAYTMEKGDCKLSIHQAYRAKCRAMDKIQGATKNQYCHLRSYDVKLLDTNKNSTVIIKCVMGAKGPIYERMYVCIEACKIAFATTSRPLIGLDGCFLKGDYGGHLLTIVGKYGNNLMLPILHMQ